MYPNYWGQWVKVGDATKAYAATVLLGFLLVLTASLQQPWPTNILIYRFFCLLLIEHFCDLQICRKWFKRSRLFCSIFVKSIRRYVELIFCKMKLFELKRTTVPLEWLTIQRVLMLYPFITCNMAKNTLKNILIFFHDWVQSQVPRASIFLYLKKKIQFEQNLHIFLKINQSEIPNCSLATVANCKIAPTSGDYIAQ